MKQKLYEIVTQSDGEIDKEKAARQYTLIVKNRLTFAAALNSMGIKSKRTATGKRSVSGSSVPYAAQSLVEQLRTWKKEYDGMVNRKQDYKVLRRVYHGEVIAYEYTSVKDAHLAFKRIKDKIREMRRQEKHIYEGGDINTRIMYRKPLGLLREFQSKRLKIQKRPNDNAEYVGIEIECITPSGMDLTPLLPFAKYIEVGGDGSIDHESGENGTEIRVCMRRDEIREVLPSLMQTLRGMGARVNKSCGLHVHLDQRNNQEPEKVFLHLVRSLGLLYTVVPESRRRNRYCKRNRHADFEQAVRGDRYKAINASAFHRYRTIEVRLFGGTLEETKIINWIETLYAVAYGETVMRCPKTFDTALKYWKLSDENLTWLKARLAKFSSLNAGMPVSEHETEENQRLLDETQSDDDDETVYCENCDITGDHWTSDCEESEREAA